MCNDQWSDDPCPGACVPLVKPLHLSHEFHPVCGCAERTCGGVMIRIFAILLITVLFAAAAFRSISAAPPAVPDPRPIKEDAGHGGASDHETLVTLNPSSTYLTVNGEPITGNDVLNLIIEQSWEKELSSFIQHQLCVDEINEAKIAISQDEVNAE